MIFVRLGGKRQRSSTRNGSVDQLTEVSRCPEFVGAGATDAPDRSFAKFCFVTAAFIMI